MKTALLLSGGMDSLSIAWWKRPDVAITINYGQLAANAEILASTMVCQELNIQHIVIDIDCRALGSGDMAGTSVNVNAPASDWWPYRNQLLITLAAMKAISLDVSHLWIGTVKSDGIHLDGTPNFIAAIGKLVIEQEGKMQVEAPAIAMSTADLVRVSKIPPSFLAWAHSCHKANTPCGQCRGCNKYLQTFQELGYDLDRSARAGTA